MAALRRAPAPTVDLDDTHEIALTTDVLVVGGGPAAAWTAIAATEAGARTVLVDKGWCGTSGVAAAAGVGHWLLPRDAGLRDAEIAVREARGGHLSDRTWIEAVLDTAWDRTSLVDGWGYRPRGVVRPTDRSTGPDRTFAGTAPDYLRFLRGRVRRGGARILDHSPALELVRDDDGRVRGAQGHQPRAGRAWSVRAGAVVLATGGTTWRSHALGGDVDTGEGHLMAVEVGAHLSSMEFSSFYGMVPFGTSMDKNGFMVGASYRDHHGRPLPYRDLHETRVELLAASERGTVTARLDHVPPGRRDAARAAMPNFFMVTDKLGVDPFTEHFPIDWVTEGTVRGTGGLHLAGTDASTGVPGLYAAGDVAARDRLVGAATGAGGPNLSWAVATGTWAGTAAADEARTLGRHDGPLHPAGGLGLRGETPLPGTPEPGRVLAAVQAETHPPARSVLKDATILAEGAATLRALARTPGVLVPADGPRSASAVRTREVAGMLQTARWVLAAATARTETRAMHHRTDHPSTDPAQTRRLLTGGLAEPWVRPDPEPPRTGPVHGPDHVGSAARDAGSDRTLVGLLG